jgi:hypothetical protein
MSPRATESGLRVAGISTDKTKLLTIGDFPRGGKPANIDPSESATWDRPNMRIIF